MPYFSDPSLASMLLILNPPWDESADPNYLLSSCEQLLWIMNALGAGVYLHVLNESELGVLVTHKVIACCVDETVDYLLLIFQ